MYLVLTAFAVPFQIGATIPGKVPPPDALQADGSVQILNICSARATQGASYGFLKGGYASVHDLLAAMGLARWNLPVSLPSTA
jgi:hypothetical protein